MSGVALKTVNDGPCYQHSDSGSITSVHVYRFLIGGRLFSSGIPPCYSFPFRAWKGLDQHGHQDCGWTFEPQPFKGICHLTTFRGAPIPSSSNINEHTFPGVQNTAKFFIRTRRHRTSYPTQLDRKISSLVNEWYELILHLPCPVLPFLPKSFRQKPILICRSTK